MANEEISSSPEREKQQGSRLVTIFYSLGHDLYRVPSIERPCWLSVEVYPLPPPTLTPDALYLGPSTTADGKAWRKAYALAWRAVLSGDRATLPADDPMVLDYQAFSVERSAAIS
jgi:hypothetical protein